MSVKSTFSTNTHRFVAVVIYDVTVS